MKINFSFEYCFVVRIYRGFFVEAMLSYQHMLCEGKTAQKITIFLLDTEQRRKIHKINPPKTKFEIKQTKK